MGSAICHFGVAARFLHFVRHLVWLSVGERNKRRAIPELLLVLLPIIALTR